MRWLGPTPFVCRKEGREQDRLWHHSSLFTARQDLLLFSCFFVVFHFDFVSRGKNKKGVIASDWLPGFDLWLVLATRTSGIALNSWHSLPCSDPDASGACIPLSHRCSVMEAWRSAASRLPRDALSMVCSSRSLFFLSSPPPEFRSAPPFLTCFFFNLFSTNKLNNNIFHFIWGYRTLK
jgi:hypothetical protein